MKGFAKSLVVDGRRVRLVVFPTVAKVRTQDYREVGHVMPSAGGGYDCVRCGQIVAHAEGPREAVEALVREYNGGAAGFGVRMRRGVASHAGTCRGSACAARGRCRSEPALPALQPAVPWMGSCWPPLR